jgi:hypothetical protein
MSINQTLFIPLFTVACVTFCYSCWQRLQLVAAGSGEDRFDNPGARLAGTLAYAFGQKRVLARPYGVNHFILFWAFMLLLVANIDFLLEGLLGASGLSFLPDQLRHGLEFAFDIVSLLALVSVTIALVRRLFAPPAYLGNDYTSPRSGEALLILGMIAALMLAFFLLNGARMVLEGTDGLKPISSVFAGMLAALPSPSLQAVAAASWWAHAVVLLLFMNFLPRSKHMHILTAIPKCYFRSLEKPNVQPREVFEKDDATASEVGQFSWKICSTLLHRMRRCRDLARHNTSSPSTRRIIPISR